MAKRRVDLLLDEGLVDRVDAAAAEKRWSRTTYVLAALEFALDGSEAAVPKARGVQQAVERSRVEKVPVPSPPASSRPPGVMRGSDVRATEPNVDRFEKTDDYRRAMALFRARAPWQHLMKNPKQGEGS